MIPSQFKPSSAEEFIGPAHTQAKAIERMIALARKNDRAPIRLLIIGEPGCGKSSLAEYFVKCIGADKWSVTKLNGVQAKIEEVEEIAKSLHYTNLFGDYRVIRLEEIDAMPRIAQIRSLTLFDDLPKGVAFVATSNCSIHDLESRFQSRFQVIQLKEPSAEEIATMLIARWAVSASIARQISTLAMGNVRQALLDCQSYLAG